MLNVKKMRAIGASWLAFPLMALGAATGSTPSLPVNDTFAPAPEGTVQLRGVIGHKIDLDLSNLVLCQDVEKLIQPFRNRTEVTLHDWRGEYWGKWLTSAILGYEYRPTVEQKSQINGAVRELLKTQLPDGYIGTHAMEHRLETWDLWCRKYVLLGLIADYDFTGNKSALEAASRNADTIIDGLRDRKLKILETGFNVLQGLDSSDLLEPFALLYQRTGDRRYLEFAESILAEWSAPSKYAPQGLHLIEDALAGAPPLTNHAYCIMSAFEGVCELYRATGDKKFLAAAAGSAQSVRQYELMVDGSVSYKERFYHGAARQTETLDEQQETCATATWMKLCARLLRLTGDPVWADEMENSLYNALLGAMTPNGDWWAYFSPLKGARVPSHIQHNGDVGLSCCVANGPRGLLLTPRWAVMTSAAGPIINLYAPGTARVRLNDGTPVEILQETDYPVNGQIKLTLTAPHPSTFTLSLRIPAWSLQTSLLVNGQPVTCAPGTYAKLNREWSSGDRVILTLNLRGRSVRAPNGDVAVKRGPILLALDSRLAPREDADVRLAMEADGYVKLVPSASKPANIWMAFDVPFQVSGGQFKNVTLCDYASAGNEWKEQNRYQVWLPQPLEMRKIYVDVPWPYLHSEDYTKRVRPTISAEIKKRKE